MCWSGSQAKKKGRDYSPALKVIQEKTNEKKVPTRMQQLHFRYGSYQLPEGGHIGKNPQTQRGSLGKNEGASQVDCGCARR
jgi:hypothetical protein